MILQNTSLDQLARVMILRDIDYIEVKIKELHWDKIADFDLINSIGDNTGLQYNYTDTNVVNGFEYWYSITAYDKGNAIIRKSGKSNRK